MEALPTDRETLKTRVKQATAEMFEEIARLRMAVEERVASQTQRIQVLEEELADRARERDRLAARIDELQKDRDAARKETLEAGTLAREAREKILAQEKDLHTTHLQIQTLSVEKEAAGALRAQVDGLAKDATRLAAEKDALLARLAQIQDASLVSERLEHLLVEARAKGAQLAKGAETLRRLSDGATEAALAITPLVEALENIAVPLVHEAAEAAKLSISTAVALPIASSGETSARISQLMRMVEALDKKVSSAPAAAALRASRAQGARVHLSTPAHDAIREAIERAFKNL